MPSPIVTIGDAVIALKMQENQDLVEFAMQRINSGEYVLGFNADEMHWEVRGNYQTLITIDREGDVWFSEDLLEELL